MARKGGSVLLGLVVALGLAAAIAIAQEDQSRDRGGRGGFGGPGGFMGGMMPGGGGGAMYLANPQVQEELKLTEEQKTKLREMAQGMMGSFANRGGFGGNEDMTEEERQKRRDEFRQEMEKVQAETTKKLAEILQPEQLKRLKQIELQQQGAAALRRPEVADTIGLTEEQKEKLEAIETESREKMRQRFSERSDDGEQQRGPGRFDFEEFRKAREETEGKAMAVLTAEQKQKLRDMMGEPFELDRSRMFQGPGGRSGGDGDRGGRRRPRVRDRNET
jgi:Spy/CpxP family protein refolding chaperone